MNAVAPGVNPFFGQIQAPFNGGQPGVAPNGQAGVQGIPSLDIVQNSINSMAGRSNALANSLQSLDGGVGGDQLAALNNAAQQFGVNQTAYQVAIQASQSFLRTVKQTASGWFA